MKAVCLGLLLSSLGPLTALLAADAVDKAAKDATRGWQNAPAEKNASGFFPVDSFVNP